MSREERCLIDATFGISSLRAEAQSTHASENSMTTN